MSASFSLGPDGVYHCGVFEEKFDWQQHGFGTRRGNPPVDITLKQIHSATVMNAAEVNADRSHEGDALITNQLHRRIGIRTADCVPILLLDASRRAVAAVHAGWRGTAAAIVRLTVERLEAVFGADPQQVYAAIGPCIRSCCYEVGDDVAQQFDSSFRFRKEPAGKFQLDLAAANRHQLELAGVPSRQIFDCERCTACELAVFFSYRREPQNPGRMVASIGRCR